METLFTGKRGVGDAVTNGNVVRKATPFFWHTPKKLLAPPTI
jgi:hypothetical protein